MRIRNSVFCIGIVLLVSLLLSEPIQAQGDDITPEQPIGSAQGQVTMLTAGADTPAGLPVVLYILEGFEPTQVFTETLSADGSFTFVDIPLIEGNAYVATLEYQQVSFGSAFVEYDGIQDTLRLDMEVYEATRDPSFIQVGRMHIIVDFFNGMLQVSELYIFDNLGDRVYAGPTGDPSQGTLKLPLPIGAVAPLVERSMGDSMVPTTSSVIPIEGGFRDTLPLRPGVGSQQLILSYNLDYDREAIVSHNLPYTVKSISLFVPDIGFEVDSEMLLSSGSRNLQEMPFMQWDASELAAGEVLSFRISGEPEMSSPIADSSMDSTHGSPFPLSVQAGDNPTTWAIGAGGFLLAAGVVAYAWRKGQKRVVPNPRKVCLHAIVDLEQSFQAGEISRGLYELERERLKAELRGWYEPSA